MVKVHGPRLSKQVFKQLREIHCPTLSSAAGNVKGGDVRTDKCIPKSGEWAAKTKFDCIHKVPRPGQHSPSSRQVAGSRLRVKILNVKPEV